MDNGHDVKHRKIITNIPQYLAQQQTSIFRQNMECYANECHVIEGKRHVNVCHVNICHVNE